MCRCALLRRATHCNALRCTATHCSTLQHTAAHCSMLQHTAAHCSMLQHTAAHCSTLQHTAAHCNTLQHTASHCIRVHRARYVCGACREHAHENIRANPHLIHAHTTNFKAATACSVTDTTCPHKIPRRNEQTTILVTVDCDSRDGNKFSLNLTHFIF